MHLGEHLRSSLGRLVILYLTLTVFCLSTSEFFLLMLIIKHHQLMLEPPEKWFKICVLQQNVLHGTISLDDYGKIGPSCRFIFIGLQAKCVVSLYLHNRIDIPEFLKMRICKFGGIFIGTGRIKPLQLLRLTFTHCFMRSLVFVRHNFYDGVMWQL